MTAARSVMAAALGLAALLSGPSHASAQEPQQPPARAGDTELVFEREVFQYPSFTRRNPFRPLAGAEGGGPRFEQLNLIGIMYSPDPSASVAIVSTGGVAVAEDGTMSAIAGDAYNLKVGDRIGNTTIVAIRRDAVDVDVEVFDTVERHTMNFVSRRQGGTP
jgi:hypothetical protein